MPGTTSACTVTVGLRSRRQTMGYSWSYSTEAIWPSGTVLPLGSGTCRVRMVDSDMRCSAEARTTTSTRWMPLRSSVAVTPDTTVFSDWARSCELRPSRRAWSWSTRMRTVRAGSIQS